QIVAPRCSSTGTSPITLRAVRGRARLAAEVIDEPWRPVGARELECERGLVRIARLCKTVERVFGHRASALASEPAGREPALDLIEAIEPPERLAIDDDVRRPEHATRHRLLDFALEPLLDLRRRDRRAGFGCVDAFIRCDRNRLLRIGDVDIGEE